MGLTKKVGKEDKHEQTNVSEAILQTSCYSTCEPTSGALCPVLHPQEPEGHCCTGISLAEGAWGSQGWEHTTNKEGLKSLFGLSKAAVEGSKYYLQLPNACWVCWFWLG